MYGSYLRKLLTVSNQRIFINFLALSKNKNNIHQKITLPLPYVYVRRGKLYKNDLSLAIAK
jgi:hypothetical protein